MTYYRSREGRYVKIEPEREGFRSEVLPGFLLDQKRLREAFKPHGR